MIPAATGDASLPDATSAPLPALTGAPLLGGSLRYNQELSERRADSVADFLAARPRRLIAHRAMPVER